MKIGKYWKQEYSVCF